MLITMEKLKDSVTYQFIEEQGRKRGEEETLRKALSTLLVQRFGALPAPVKEKIKAASTRELNRWLKRVVTAPSVADALK